MAEFELYQFAISHYNEKARWALDWKRLPHLRHSLLPGPHKLAMMRLSGQDQVPVLKHAEHIVPGSAEILAYLEEIAPEPRLVPEAPDQARRALEIQSHFDREVGPAVRLARFFVGLNEPEPFVAQFTQDKGALKHHLYRAAFPLVKRLMVSQMQINAANAERANAIIRAALDQVAKTAGPEGYLVGDAFSIADLAAASLLMPAVEPKGGPKRPPEPAPAIDAWLALWHDHPGAAWVRGIYERHRGVSAEVSA